MIKVENFEKDGKKIWDNGNGFTSGCLKVEIEKFNPETGIVNTEVFMNWIKAKDEETVDRHIGIVKSQLEKGTLVPFRVFSETPFYEKDVMQINPKSGESMNRFAQTRQASEMHRTFVTVAVKATAEPVTTGV